MPKANHKLCQKIAFGCPKPAIGCLMVCLHQTKFWFSVPFLTRFCQYFGPELFQTVWTFGNKICCMSKILCRILMFSVPILYQKPKNLDVKNYVQILCLFCAKFGMKKHKYTRNTEKWFRQFFTRQIFGTILLKILDRKVSENGTEIRISSSVNRPLYSV